jgi:putative oxidoreductase
MAAREGTEEGYNLFTLISQLRKTSNDQSAGVVRIALGILFLMTGAMKLLVPVLAEAWSGQLLAAKLPFYEINRWMVPFLEMALGALLLVGAYARPAAAMVIGIMAVATYVHFAVDDPSLFPLQPSEPIIPLVVIVLAVYIMWRGAGAWSSDQKA